MSCPLAGQRRHGVLAVADGWWPRGGERASRLAVQTIQQTIPASPSFGRPESGDRCGGDADGIEAANDKVAAWAPERATTPCSWRFATDCAVVHVGRFGDSLVGQRGKLKFQTIAHSPIGYAVEAGPDRREGCDSTTKSGT